MPFFFQTVAILLWGTIWLHPAAIPELNSMFEEVMEPREVALILTLKILHPPSVCRALNTGGQRRVNYTHYFDGFTAGVCPHHSNTILLWGRWSSTLYDSTISTRLPRLHSPSYSCRLSHS